MRKKFVVYRNKDLINQNIFLLQIENLLHKNLKNSTYNIKNILQNFFNNLFI